MTAAEQVAAVLWLGTMIYAIFGGADFGAGLWDLLAGNSKRGVEQRELIDRAMGHDGIAGGVTGCDNGPRYRRPEPR